VELIDKRISVGAFKDKGENLGAGGQGISLSLQQFIFNAIRVGKKQPETWRDAEGVN
jgi:hypothetical protein